MNVDFVIAASLLRLSVGISLVDRGDRSRRRIIKSSINSINAAIGLVIES